MDLTEEQKAIVELPLESRTLVTAGAGTGKTSVLIARLSQLIAKYNLKAGREILILSFSRSAVSEIRRRTQSASDNIRFVRAQTFDSFGTRLLMDIDPNGPWNSIGWSYEQRIDYVTEMIKKNTETKDKIKQYAHVFVDELQDLVGSRAKMVEAILETSNSGFTLLGDPAQGIYNFQLQGAARKLGSMAFYRWAREYFKNELIEKTLTINHRAKSETVRKALWAGPALIMANPNYALIKNNLEAVIMELPPLNKPEQIVTFLKPIPGKTAILCRNNGQALLVSRHLWSLGISHALQRQAVDRVLPKWIGTILIGSKQKKVGKSFFLEKYESLFEDDPQQAWRSVKRIEDGPSRDMLDLGLLSERIRLGAVPDELCEYPSDSLVVSTIHRAKGLEFERVAILVDETDSIFRYDFDLELSEETRVIYVALTRSTSEMYQMILPQYQGFLTKELEERWIIRFGKWRYTDFEINGDDVNRDDPAGGPLQDYAPLELQDYIINNVKTGDPVELVYKKVRDENFPGFSYEVMHSGKPVGIMSRRFLLQFYNILCSNWRNRNKWPANIKNIRVETVDTVAGIEGAGRKCELGDCDIWVRVRIAGLGHFNFKTDEN